MQNFFKIRAEKQEHIINAGFQVFGKQGYRKASVGDIANAAGVTKGMIAYYFGSKKNLYLYLVEVSQTRMTQAIKERITPDVTDFFEKMKIATEIQLAAFREHPALIKFLNSIYFETELEVVEDIKQIAEAEDNRFNRVLLDGTDFSKFEPGVDPHLICKFIFWADYGFMTEMMESDSGKVMSLVAEFYSCLDVMRKIFYREA